MTTLKNYKCDDIDSNSLHIGDKVVVLYCECLETNTPIKRGDILSVLHLNDPVSNFVSFTNGEQVFSFFGHRVLKINQ